MLHNGSVAASPLWAEKLSKVSYPKRFQELPMDNSGRHALAELTMRCTRFRPRQDSGEVHSFTLAVTHERGRRTRRNSRSEKLTEENDLRFCPISDDLGSREHFE